MIDYVEISPKGLFVYKWDGKKKKNIKKRAKKLEVCSYLRCSCKIAEGTTLQDIFDMVASYRFLKMVISQYSWCREIDAFHAQAVEYHEPEEDENSQESGLVQSEQIHHKDDKIEYLEIYHHVETNEVNEKIKHPGGLRERIKTIDFECSPCFHGIGPEPKKQNYSVSYSPMWKLANLPVKINEEFDVHTRWDNNKKSTEKVLTSTRDFSLLEVLDAIYWDISFMGGPEANAAFIADLDEQVDKIKSGEVAGIPWEQVKKRLSVEPIKESDEDELEPEGGEKKLKVILHPDVARFLGVNPDDIPLDDKEIMRPDDKKEE